MTSHYNNILLVVLCGLPGAGKSTLIKQLDQYLTQYYDNCPLNNAIWTKCQTHVWSIDKLLPQWHMPTTAPSQVESTFKQDRHMIQTQVEACLQQLTSMAVTNQPLSHILFVDDNMYYTSMRHTYYQLAQKYKVTFLQLWLECDLVTALKRNSQRTSLKQCVPDDIIRRMAKRFEPPQSPLHFQSNSTDNDMNTTHTILLDHSIQAWEYNTVTWLSANKNVHDAHQVTRWIGESFWPAWQWAACRQQIYQQQNELTKQQTIQEQQRITQDYLHQLNIALNRQIGRYMQHLPLSIIPLDIKIWSRHLRSLKQKHFFTIKQLSIEQRPSIDEAKQQFVQAVHTLPIA